MENDNTLLTIALIILAIIVLLNGINWLGASVLFLLATWLYTQRSGIAIYENEEEK